MNTARTWQTKSTSLKDTLAIAEKIGSRLRGGEAIQLASDLGAGKTAFVRGLAEGMGSKDAVHSPSFTLSNQYQSKDLTLYHFDFYRLNEPGILRDELAEILQDDKAVVAVEWADIVENILPPDHLTVIIKAIDENRRDITINFTQAQNYLLPANT